MWNLRGNAEKMKVNIRQERKEDHQTVHDLVERAFRNEEVSDHTEQFLVNNLRKSDAFIPQLSLVATSDDKVIGHILLTKIKIKGKHGNCDALALAPVSVLPEYHKMGIGSNLIHEAHRIAKKMGFKSVILLGHESYYPRFGYKKTSTFGITLPFEAPEEICMALELVPDALHNVSGVVVYPKEFFE